MDLWNDDQPIGDRFEGVDVPAWIDDNVSPYDVAAIARGGCASGAYMPAVTYHKAVETMTCHGTAILDYISDALGEVPMPDPKSSWEGMACHFVSTAVELWASLAESILDEVDEPD